MEWDGFMIYSVDDDKKSRNGWDGQFRNSVPEMDCDTAKDNHDGEKQQRGKNVLQKAFPSLIAIVQRLY
jgi:hypothetical protein